MIPGEAGGLVVLALIRVAIIVDLGAGDRERGQTGGLSLVKTLGASLFVNEPLLVAYNGVNPPRTTTMSFETIAPRRRFS